MRLVVINNGIVVNVIISDELLANSVQSDHANIGDIYDGQAFSSPAIPATLSSLAIKKSIKAEEIKALAGMAIIAGIQLNDLGPVYMYPTTRDDQINLIGLITESLLPGSGDEYRFWCADVNGVWARRVHTKLQIQGVGKAVAGYVKSQQAKYEEKLIAISLADVDTIDLIVW